MGLDSLRRPPSSDVLNVLQQTKRPVRWNIDQRDRTPVVVYPDVPDSAPWQSHTIDAPLLEDPRVVGVYYDVHPNELDQAEIGRSLERDGIYNVMSRQVNSLASPGERLRNLNMGAIFPGERDNREYDELRLAHYVLQSAYLWNPDVAFELHNTPLADDGMLFVRRDVEKYVGRVAAYISRKYELPIVEAPERTLTGNHRRFILMEMPSGDPRFTVDAWRHFLEMLVYNKLDLPDESAEPQYSFYRDISRREWLDAGQVIGPRAAFSLLDEDIAFKLNLPTGVRTVNWEGGSEVNPWIGATVVPFRSK